MDTVYQNRWKALAFIGVSLLVISLDNTILNVALPSIANQLGATATDLQWIVDAYILVFAALLLTMGSIGDRIGRKRALQMGLVLFGIGSLAAALSTSTEMLIASRAFLGIGGATIMPATLSIITATFRDSKERSQAIAIWAATFGLGVGVGPVIGGYLLKFFDWNSVFFINLPVVVIAILGGYYFISESKDEDAPPPDVPGVILSIIGLFALIYGIIEAGFAGWTDDKVLIAFGVSVVVLSIFAWWESRTEKPMLPLYFFKNMSFTGANLGLILVMFSMFGSFFFFTQYFQSVQGYTPLEAGLRIFPMALVLTISAGISAKVSGKLGIKLTVGLGILLASAGLFFMSQIVEVDTAYSTILIGFAIVSAGMGMAMSPATDSVMGSVPPSKAGVGSAMNDTTRQLGGALGVAVLGTVMNNIYLDKVSSLRDIPILQAMLPEEAFAGISNSIQAAHIIAGNAPIPAAQQTIITTANEAFVAGMAEGLFIGAIIMLVASIITLVILPSRIRPAQEVEETTSEKVKQAVPATAIGD